jgi:hypothetical protein
MPEYVFNSSVPMIFGEYRYGTDVEIKFNGHEVGDTVVLSPGERVVFHLPIEHPFLEPVSDVSEVTVGNMVSKKKRPAKATTEDVAVEVIPEPATEDAPVDKAPVTKD